MSKYIILTIALFLLLFNIDIVLFSVKDSSILFFNKIFISVFPFIILSDILIYYNYPLFIKNSFIGKIISKIFNIDYNSTTIFILSLLTSHPNNAIYIKNMLDNKIIDIKTANNLLCFTYFPSISFVVGTIGISIFNNIKIGIYLYLNCLLNNIIIGLYLRKKQIKLNINNDIINNNNNFFDTLKNSIIKAINNLYLILGNLIIFTIILNILNNYFNLNPIIESILSGLFELTNGIINTSKLNINSYFKISIISFILNFSGLCVLFQSFSILSKYNINIKKILIIKLIFSFIAGLSVLPILHVALFHLFP